MQKRERVEESDKMFQDFLLLYCIFNKETSVAIQNRSDVNNPEKNEITLASLGSRRENLNNYSSNLNEQCWCSNQSGHSGDERSCWVLLYFFLSCFYYIFF